MRMQKRAAPRLYTKGEAADLLRVCLRQIDYLIAKGLLKKVKIGSSSRVTSASIEELIGATEPAE